MKQATAEYVALNNDNNRALAYEVNNNNMSLNDLQEDFNPFVISLEPIAPNNPKKIEVVLSLLTEEKLADWQERNGVRDYPTAADLRNGWIPVKQKTESESKSGGKSVEVAKGEDETADLQAQDTAENKGEDKKPVAQKSKI